MKILSSFKKLFISIGASFKRFPATLMLTASVAVMLIIISELTGHNSDALIKTLSRISMVIALGVPISLCIKFYFERCISVRQIIRAAVYITAAIILVLYYYFLLPNENMVPLTRYVAFNITFYLIALFIPYFYEKENFELYIIKLIYSFIITMVFSLVIFLGISAILFTIDKLLGVHVYNNLYYYTWLIIAGIFAPAYFLSGVPLTEYVCNLSEYPKVLKILLLYIVMPIISVYTLILYIYLGKVAVTHTWPINMVGNLVLWYSLISTLVIFLVWPLRPINKWVDKFIFWFIKLILPLIVIMFMSLGIRIRAFGVTENRYYVIILGLWVLGIMLYWNFRKNKRNIVLPISLAIVAFLAVCGPWSSYSISISSQNKRFENILAKYNMISKNQITKPSKAISSDDEKEISEIVQYFSNNHSLKDIKSLPKDFKLTDMKNVFGFEFDPNRYYMEKANYFSYSLFDINVPFDVSGYDLLFSFKPKGMVITQSKDNIKVEYKNESNIIIIYNNSQEIYKNNLNNFIKKIYEKYGSAGNNTSPEDMTFADENNKVKVKFIFYNIYGNKNNTENDFRVDSVDFDMFLKIK